MESFLGAAVLVLFVLFFAYRGTMKQLSAEIDRLNAAVAAHDTALSQLLTVVGPEPGRAVTAPAETARDVPAAKAVGSTSAGVQASPGAPQAAAESPLDRRWERYRASQTRSKAVLETVSDVAAEAVPTVALASAAAGVAQQAHRRDAPSALDRWLAQVRTSEEWEALIGGRLLNRIGAIALILGAAFFFKYAADQNWISQWMRVGFGLAVGAGLLAAAARFHRRGYAIFSQGLVGAGLAILYLSVYASFNFYHLVPQPVALAGMGLVTALALGQALYYDSIAVSLLACAGGYATPFLLNAGSGSPLGTVVYVFLLDLSTLGVLGRKRSWVVLEPIALGATYLTYFTWYLSAYSSGRIVLAAIAISLFWSLFLAFDVFDLLRSGAASPELRHALATANGLAYYLGLFALFMPQHQGLMSLLTLAIGAVYVAVLLSLRGRPQLSTGVAARYTLTGIVLLVVATALRFGGFTLVALWSLEALPLVWYGARWKLWYVWRPAPVLFGLAACLLFATPGALAYQGIASFHPLVNERALAFLVLAAALAVSTLPVRRLRPTTAQTLGQCLHYGWTTLVFILLTVETVDLFRRLMLNTSVETQSGLQLDRSLALALVWTAYALPLVWFGLRRRAQPWLTAGLGSAACGVALAAVAGITYQPIQRFIPVANVRTAAFVLLMGALLLLLRWLSRNRDAADWIGFIERTVQVVILVLGFEAVSAEINDYFLHRFGHPLTSMDTGGAFIELAVLAAIWMLYSLLPTWYGVRRRTMPLIATGLSMTAAATGVAAFGGVVVQPSHQFATLLGIRPFVLAVIVGGLVIQLRLLRAAQPTYRWAGNAVVLLQAAIILLGFGLSSAETRDAFAQRIAGASLQAAATLRDLERLAFSMVWLAYAILVMGLGIWRRARWMRIGAMALFAIIIVKVFAYDLSFLGAAYRPISFAGLGVILLAVSFLYQRYRSILFAAK